MTESSLPTVTVVIPTNGGRAETIGRTLPILLADPATSEVIVAFDSDDPATRELTDTYARSDDRVKRIRTNSGAAPTGNRGQSAREAAARVAHGELVLALDDDLEPEQGLVSGHAQRHAAAAMDLIVVGYTPVSPEDGSPPTGPNRLYSEVYEQDCSRFLADEGVILTGLWGGHVSLLRRRWLEAGYPAVALDYHDDREFGLRLLETGVKGVFDPRLRAIHRHQRTQMELLRDARSSGRAQARLHTAYPALVRPPQESLNAARRISRIVVWLSRPWLGWRVTTGTLLLANRAFAAARLTSAEDVSTRLLWRVGFARGVREAR